MNFAQTNKCRFAGLLLAGFVCCFCMAQQAAEPQASLGELKLEGDRVERLVLRRDDGYTERFNNPKGTIRLPVGQYHVLESHLSGGYTCFPGQEPNLQRVTVTEKEPALLKVGAPLKKTLSATRHRRLLVLDFKLLGAGGESYTKSDRAGPPSFTIYRGDKQIASGKFEYG